MKGDRSPAAIERWANITESHGGSNLRFTKKHGRQVDIFEGMRNVDISESGGYLICVPDFF